MRIRFLNQMSPILAMVAGLITGLFPIDWLVTSANVCSDLFLRLLQFISLPMIFLAITSTLSGMRSFSEVRALGQRVLGYTLLTTVLAATIALTLYLLIHPQGQHLSIVSAPEVASEGRRYLSFVMDMIPENFVSVFAQGNVMGIVTMGIAFGLGTLFLPPEQKGTLHQFFSSFFALLLKLTNWIIRLMPIAIWAFVTLLVVEFQDHYAHAHTLWPYLLTIVGANLVQGFVVLPILLKIKKRSPIQLFRAMAPALSMAFFSKSSNATLPLTIELAEKRAGMRKKMTSFCLPLCTVINMNGCAAFILVTTLFVSSLAGHVFTPLDYATWVVLATLAAIGNAGVPMGCYFLTSAFLVGMDVPLHMMGLILPFYTLIDMVETALNVWSDSCVTSILDHEYQEQVAPEEASVA